MTTVNETNAASAEAYYQAMNDKDLAGMARHLHPDVRVSGPLYDLTGKDAVLEEVERLLPLVQSVGVSSKFGSTDQAMLAIDLEFAGSIGICRSAVLMTFKDGLIARSEIFFDPRPFQKNLSEDSTSSSS
jgi:hypothetical protein